MADGKSFVFVQVKITTGLTKGVAVVEWEASPPGDVIADAAISILMLAQSSSASIRLTSKPCHHSSTGEPAEGQPPEKKRRETEESTTESRLRLFYDTLKDQFDEVEAVYEGNSASYEIKVDCGLETSAVDENGVLTCTAKVTFDDETGGYAEIAVECADLKLAANVQECLRNLAAAAAPIDI
jgi:hypothetical protein